MTTMLIIDKDNYRRNTLTRKMVNEGFVVFDVKDEFEAIDIVLSLAETSPIHYLLASEDNRPYPTLRMFCELKFGNSLQILNHKDIANKISS